MVELRPGEPTGLEYVVWLWVATMWSEELRQVGQHISMILVVLNSIQIALTACASETTRALCKGIAACVVIE